MSPRTWKTIKGPHQWYCKFYLRNCKSWKSDITGDNFWMNAAEFQNFICIFFLPSSQPSFFINFPTLLSISRPLKLAWVVYAIRVNIASALILVNVILMQFRCRLDLKGLNCLCICSGLLWWSIQFKQVSYNPSSHFMEMYGNKLAVWMVVKVKVVNGLKHAKSLVWYFKV